MSIDRNLRTDLAMEANEYLASQNKSPSDGIVTRKAKSCEGVETDIVEVTTNEAAEALGKEMGTYITFSSDVIKDRDPDLFEDISECMADAMTDMLSDADKKKGVLVIGLGNRYMTADSLGPRVVEKTMVTRHILKMMPDKVDERLRPVSAIAPGVMGVTGIETSEVIESLVGKINPGAIIAVDALASMSTDRICSTIQVADTGISPGAGVGNKTRSLNKESLGIPVIAIGSPTVVYASTIVKEMTKGNILDNSKLKTIEDMIVTPREIDVAIDDIAKIISMALNLLIHKGINAEQVNTFLN